MKQDVSKFTARVPFGKRREKCKVGGNDLAGSLEPQIDDLQQLSCNPWAKPLRRTTANAKQR